MSAAAPVTTKYIREYQPVDKNGFAIGPKQRFEADTLDELADKLASAHQAASANLYETKKAAKLGDLLTKEDEDDPIYEYQPRALTADERVKLAKEINDPEKAPKAMETMFEALIGAPLEAVRGQLRENMVAKLSEKARATVETFCTDHPEYIRSQNNHNLLVKYMEKHDLRFNKKNLESAYQDLRSADLLTVQAPRPAENNKVETPTAPAIQPAEPATPPAPAIPAPATQTPPATSNSVGSEPVEPLRPRQSSSGLSRDSGGTQPPPTPVKAQGITVNDITRLTADEYSEALRDGLYRYTNVKDPNTGRATRQRGEKILDAKEFQATVDKLLGGK